MKCPGQDSRYWKPESIFEVRCPNCGQAVEFFKDDTMRKCPHCGHKFVNPKMDFGCAAYCQYAEQCLGVLPDEVRQQREEMLKDRVAQEMERYFGPDKKRINHARQVARYARLISEVEGGNMGVILLAAYLHDIGSHEAERRYNSTAPKHQEEFGPPIAREILSKVGFKNGIIDEVCDIIGHHHHPREQETLNFKILYDADLIVNLLEGQQKNPMTRERLEKVVQKSFFTATGKQEAAKALLNGF